MALNPILFKSLDLTLDTPLLMLEKVVTGLKAWTSAELFKQDWKVVFSEEVLDEIRVMAERMRANPLTIHLREPDEFQIPKLRQTLSQARKILDQGCGFCVIERMPMEEFSKEEMISCYWVVSQLVGRPVAQKWDGTMIYDVTDTGQSFSYGVRGSYTNVELVFHNDNWVAKS